MRNHPNAVSINPYFAIKPGQLETVKAKLPQFVERTASEPKCLFYGFTMHGEALFCQEAYEGAEGVLAHLDNVGALLGELLELAELTRLEIHGPAEELRKLEGPLASMGPTYYTWQCGLE
jgi:quinol monooxygenase YgiN